MESERQSRLRFYLALVKKRNRNPHARTLHWSLNPSILFPVTASSSRREDRRRAAVEAILQDSWITKISTHSHIRLAELCSNSVCHIL